MKRIFGSLAAAVTSHIMAFGLPAHGDEICGLREVAAYQKALAEPNEEATPAYILKIATRFLETCPDRYEVRDVHVVAARAALDNGQADIAAEHYAKAVTAGLRLTPAARLDQSVALLASGEPLQSRAARNQAVLDWLTNLYQKDAASLSVKSIAGGLIYHADFTGTVSDPAVSEVWLAVPDGPELPSAVVGYRDDVRAAWKNLRRQAPIDTLNVLAHRTCRDRNVLMEVVDGDLPSEAGAHAIETLKVYLSAPEGVVETAPGAPIASCLGLEHMFYVPAKAGAAPTRNAG